MDERENHNPVAADFIDQAIVPDKQLSNQIAVRLRNHTPSLRKFPQ